MEKGISAEQMPNVADIMSSDNLFDIFKGRCNLNICLFFQSFRQTFVISTASFPVKIINFVFPCSVCKPGFQFPQRNRPFWNTRPRINLVFF